MDPINPFPNGTRVLILKASQKLPGTVVGQQSGRWFVKTREGMMLLVGPSEIAFPE